MRKIIPVLLLLTLLAQAGVPGALALPQYLTNLTAVYGDGSCSTCHVNASGGGKLTPYGSLFASQPNHAIDPTSALIAAGTPPGMNATPAVTLAATPAVTMIATPEATPTPAPTPVLTRAVVTTPAATKPRTPGFGLVVSVAGVLVCFLLLRRRN